MDGNVYRVLSRYFGIDTPIDSLLGKKLFASLAQSQLDKKRPSCHNQAIMDFGALQCVPRNPNCVVCPFVDSCVAFNNDSVSELPVKERCVKIRNRYFYYFYVRGGDFTYLRKREGKDIWKGLYEPLLLMSDEKLSDDDLFSRISDVLEHDSGELTLLRKEMKHQLSHQLLHADFYLIDFGDLELSTRTWLSEYIRIMENELDLYAVPRLVSDLFDLVARRG